MKKLLLLSSITFFGVYYLNAQSSSSRGETPEKAHVSSLLSQKSAANFDVNQPKALVCQDTVHYPLVKQNYFNDEELYIFELWQEDLEAMSQTFYHSGASMSVNGVEFLARVNANSITATVTMRASVWNVNASNIPTTQVTSGTVVVSSTAFSWNVINFVSPAVMTGNYAIVLEPINTNAIIDIIVTDIVPGQVQDEDLSRFKSLWPAFNSNGLFVPIPTYNPAQDFEMVAAPIVSYNINTAYTASPNPSCLGTPVNFTNTSTPSSILNNRMFTYGAFASHFMDAVSDSTHAWNMGDATPILWEGSHSYTYATPGTKNPVFFTLGGLLAGCLDNSTTPITINDLPIITVTGDNAICSGNSAELTASGGTSYSWDNGLGTNGIVTPSPSATTTYTVTGTDNNGCSNTASIEVVVTPTDNANFAYTSSTLCTGGGNETPTINSTGTFSSNSTDLVFANTSTGEIDMTASADGSYQVTFTTNGTCPNSSVQTITITSTPEAEFSYSAASYCANEGSISPSFIPGASSGVFTVNVTGLIINASTGVINTNTSSPGVYEVTNTIAASGACPADEHTVSVTIADLPTATITGGTSVCGDASTTVELTVTLTGNGPWDFTYSDGNTSNDVNGQADATYTMTVNTSGTYTITSVSDAGCSNTGTGSAIVAINENPTVSAGADFSVCEGSIINLSGTGATSYTWDNDVINGVDFTIAATTTYTVIGTDNNGCQDSDQITVTVNEIPTVTLTDFANICEDADAIVLTGGNPANGTYTGTGVTGGEFDPSVAGVGTFTITYTFESTEGCSGSTTASITVETCSGAGIDEQSIENLSIFPNPANQNLTVSFFNNKNHAVNVVMLASDGKLIFTDSAAAMNDFNSTIDVTNLSKGVYFIQLQSASGNHVEKVIIQ